MKKVLMAILVGVTMASSVFAADKKKEEVQPMKESMGWGHMATLSPLKAPPTLDGKMEPGEWGNATHTVNFLSTFGLEEPSAKGMLMDLREGKTWCGFYSNTLYIAMVSALPPRAIAGGYHSYIKDRDSELVFDPNSIEIWLDPNRDRRESGKGDQAFYQLFVNTRGSLYDARLAPGAGVDKGFNMDIQCGNSIDEDAKIWTCEIAIPLKDIGWTPGTEIGRSIGVLICRNFKAPWTQPTWFPHGGAFSEWYRYPRLYLTPDQPVAGVESLGAGLWDAKPEFKIKIENPGPARTAKVSMHIKSSDMPDLKDTKEVALPANGSAEYSYKPGSGALHQEADHYFKVRVEAADGSRPWFDYAGMWSRDPMTAKGWAIVRWHTLRTFEQKWDIRAVAAPQQSVGITVHPSFNRIQVGLDVGMLVGDPDGKDKDAVSDKAVVILSRDGQELDKAEVTFVPTNKVYNKAQVFTLKEMPAGEYQVSVVFNKHADPIVKKYKRITFPWEGTHLGVTDKIYPPFTPVVAGPSNTAVVCRNYGVGQLGLWNSIKSMDKELLSSPIVVKLKSEMLDVKSKTSDVKSEREEILSGSAKLVKSTPMSAVYEAEAKHPAVTVKSVCTTEIDGAMKVELTLLPPAATTNSQQPTILNSLVLDIPLKDDMMPLWHACTTALRVNPMGETPKGTDVVWDSRKFPNGDWIGNFTPYIWFGGVERGLAVFGNNDKGWVLNWNNKREFSPCQELIRKDGVLTLRLNLVQKPIDLTAEAASSNAQPRKIVIGLMASPGKPIPYKDWRGILAWGLSLGKGFEYLPRADFAMPTAKEEVFCAAYPYNADYSIYDAIRGIPGTMGGDMVKEKGWGAFMADWKKRNGLDKPADQLSEAQKRVLQTSGTPTQLTSYHSAYWDEYHGDSGLHPERQVYNGEWGGNNMAASRRDFRCYHGAEAVKRGWGLYFDNAFPHATKDKLTSDAYDIAGMGVQCSAGLWEQRDYHRRIWNIHREFGAKWGNKPMSMIHMSNTAILTMLTWNDMNVDLEWFYGPEPQQSKYGIGLLQAETGARQSGCIPYALARIADTKTATEQYIAERTQFGAMMTHEIKVVLSGIGVKLAQILYGFGYGVSGLLQNGVAGETVYNYWDEDYPVTCNKPLVKSLLVKRGEELMLLVSSWDVQPCDVEFVFDTKALGLTLSSAKNAEGSAEEQAAVVTASINATKKTMADIEARLVEFRKKNEKSSVKKLETDLKAAEISLKKTEELSKIVLDIANRPIKFNARKSRLTVDLDGYGVRIIRLK